MKMKRQKGFTLVELICAIMATLILVLAGGTVLATSHSSWNSSWEKVNLQRDASQAMLKINHHIKAGIAAELEDDGKAIKIYKDSEWIRFFIEQESGSKNLKCEPEGKTVETIINGNVKYLQFDVVDNRVRISLILEKGDLEIHIISDVMIRNYGK